MLYFVDQQAGVIAKGRKDFFYGDLPLADGKMHIAPAQGEELDLFLLQRAANSAEVVVQMHMFDERSDTSNGFQEVEAVAFCREVGVPYVQGDAYARVIQGANAPGQPEGILGVAIETAVEIGAGILQAERYVQAFSVLG